jgi:hypothetical protein
MCRKTEREFAIPRQVQCQTEVAPEYDAFEWSDGIGQIYRSGDKRIHQFRDPHNTRLTLRGHSSVKRQHKSTISLLTYSTPSLSHSITTSKDRLPNVGLIPDGPSYRNLAFQEVERGEPAQGFRGRFEQACRA